jgi:hypothetical protein
MIVKRAIYDNKTSPYLKLLNSAGCEYGDLERMVHSIGIEAALAELCQKGVYISYEEFKGKRKVIRGSQTFAFKERDFDNPLISRHFEASTGATRSSGTRTTINLDYLSQRAVYYSPRLDAWDALNYPVGVWSPILPGAGPLVVLEYSKIGKIPLKWYSQTDVSIFKPPLNYKLANKFIGYATRLYGKKLPLPEYVPLNRSLQVAQWLSETVKTAGGCVLTTYPSSAVRVCQAAQKSGINIAGTTFALGGEPLSEGKKSEIEAANARVFPVYVTSEFGFAGLGCARPASADEVHVCADGLVIIQHQREVPHASVSVDAFIFTTLLPATPKIALNVETGDYGIIDTKTCGCKLEELGFKQHIHSIRGFDKLTAEGMTFLGTEFIRIIEEVLPAKFGGISTDYQIVEEEDKKGYTRMSILVSPELGEIDEFDLRQTIMATLGQTSGRWMASDIWSQAGTLQVKRTRPLSTARGKILPLHIQRNK